MYDARYWESAYREIDEAPTLIIQLQDDLTYARRREAFWISVVVHLLVVLLVVNSARIAGLIPRQTAVLSSNALPQDKDLTYLELPPDQQRPPAKRPDTNIISDKDRIATSKAPQIDRQELKKILDSSRPGRPGSSGAPEQPSTGAEAQNAPAPQPQQAPPPPPADQNLNARLQTPALSPRDAFATGPRYVGSATEQAARAAAVTRGGSGGENGDFGLGLGKQGRAYGALDVLSDTMGVDFGPYLARVLHDVKMNWYNLIPESAKAPIMKKGNVGIEFAILKDGSVAGMKLVYSSGDVALDRGAWGGITASNPFPPLPTEFGGQYLALRFKFLYNPDKTDLQ
ncbi:MAG: TonB family protein [Terriglobales bacterium]